MENASADEVSIEDVIVPNQQFELVVKDNHAKLKNPSGKNAE
jgi:hypothetical protein